jgi:hypothetical protein
MRNSWAGGDTRTVFTIPFSIAAGLVLAGVAGAHPNEPGYALRWSRSSEAQACPDRERLVSTLAEQLGRDPFDADSDRHIEVEWSRHGSTWLTTLRVRDRDGTETGIQELSSTSSDCGELFRATVAALAVMLGPFEAPEPEQSEPAAADRVQKSSLEPDPQQSTPPPDPTRVPGAGRAGGGPPSEATNAGRTWVGLGAGTALGLGPWLSPAVSLSLGHQQTNDSYIGVHSSFVFGHSEGDAPVDRLHHHSLEVGWVFGGQKVFINPGIRVGVLFLISGQEEPRNFRALAIAAGASAGVRVAESVYLGVDLRAVYVHEALVRGDTGVGLSALPVHVVAGTVL